MTKCWKDDPNLRPSFEKLRKKLKEMENQHKVELQSLQRDSLCFYFLYKVWLLESTTINLIW